MNDGSIVGHVTELLTSLQRSEPADRTIAHFFSTRRYLGSRDRRAISNTVYGIIRHRRLVESLAADFRAQAGSTPLPHPETAAAVEAVALYGLLRQVIDPATPESDAVAPGAAAGAWSFYLPGITFDSLTEWVGRTVSSVAGISPALRHSFPDWMADKFRSRFGDETGELLASLNEQAPVTVRVNTILASREKCAERLKAEGIETVPTTLSPDGLRLLKRFNRNVSQAFKDGWFEMQDEGSQLVGLACEAKPGDTVIDECAGAGGKSLHLAALMRNEGAIIARDNDSRRLIELKERAARAKCGIISIQYTGADKGGVERGARGGSDRGAKRGADGRADVVLVDAPCTGTGTIRRNPFLKWSVTPESVAHHAALQLELLTRAAADVKPGGRLVYATCSLLQEENDDVVEAFLRERSDFRAGPATWLVPHQQGTDGFFFAMMNRAAT